MLKHMLIISTAVVSVPAIAQETPPADPAAPPPTEQPDATTAPAPTDPATTAPAPTEPATTTPPAATEPAPGAAATPAQIAQIVDSEFATYDADKSNDLNESEFSAWMKKLRTATDPTVDPESEQVKGWIGQAWAAADGDKSGAVSKEELTGFLSRGA